MMETHRLGLVPEVPGITIPKSLSPLVVLLLSLVGKHHAVSDQPLHELFCFGLTLSARVLMVTTLNAGFSGKSGRGEGVI